MFDNIGSKLKGLAYTVSALGIIASILGAIVLWGANSSHNSTIGTGLLVLIVGCVVSWVGGFFTYGFGELIEQQATIISLLEKPNKAAGKPLETEFPSAPATPTSTIDMPTAWKCPECGASNAFGVLHCKRCGHYKL